MFISMSLLDRLSSLIPKGGSKKQIEYFFALNVGSQKVGAAVWGVDGKHLEILNSAEVEYGEKSLHHLEFEHLAQVCNRALDEALADLEIEPNKILFGVPDNWLQDDNLKEDYLKLLKHLVKELDVVPMAYVSSTHAISHFLHKQEGVPTTAILVGLANPLTVAVVKVGKVVGTKFIKRTDSLAEDVQKGLMSIENIEVMPSRILVYEHGEKVGADKIKDELTSFAWMQKLPFLHLPKVEVLEQGIEIDAICMAGAVEINPDVVISKKDKRIEGQHNPRLSALPLDEKSDLKKMGFIKGDIEDPRVSAEVALSEVEGMEEVDERPMGRRNLPSEIDDDNLNVPASYGEKFTEFAKKGFLGGIVSRVTGFLPGNLRRLPFAGPVIVVGILLILFLLAYLFIPKASVIVFIDPKILEKESQVIADPGISAVDEANKKIPGKVVETELTGSEKGSATGKKQIGDPAKGSVVLYNKTAAPKTFSQGTVLSSGGLTFTLDSSVNVASRSAVLGGISFGKSTANVTASQIGPEGNLSAGKELTIKGFTTDDYSASVDQALSGGTSKDVTVVTSDDQKRLLAVVTGNLRKSAKDQLQGKLSGDMKVLEEALQETVSKSSFSKQVGDQAGEFSVNVSVKYKGTAYSENDLKLMVSKLVQVNVPEGYELKLQDAETQAAVSKLEKDGKLVFLARFKAKLTPKMDLDRLKKDISGKSLEDAEARLKMLESVIGADIQVTPSLPGPLKRLPIMGKNITIEVTAK